MTPRPTIEEVLWFALRKARLISPPCSEGTGYEVEWNASARARKGASEVSWEGCQYSKCGRTDRGVSAFGQVVGVRVRSARPLLAKGRGDGEGVEGEDEAMMNGGEEGAEELPGIGSDDLVSSNNDPAFHPVNDELPYISILNGILPPTIRVLAWCPDPPPNQRTGGAFDARFSCLERRYRYFFTNPAFCPTPGPLGIRDAGDKTNRMREGWLDIGAMDRAARKLKGLHDFRNLCKIDASKQMSDCKRRISYAAVEQVVQQGGPSSFHAEPDLDAEARDGGAVDVEQRARLAREIRENPSTPQVYSFTVHGSAFLWHQVRCMAAVLFLVGQGLESLSIVDELLDVEKNPGRPIYEMASDAPLVLWDCVFAEEGQDGLDWIYAGDARSIPGLAIRNDGKFGMGGVVDEIWTQWRRHKMDEILSSSLLDLVISQGDGSALQRGGSRTAEDAKVRSQRLFDGQATAKAVGRYVSVMQKPRMDGLDEQNAKYQAGKGARRALQQNGQLEVSSED